MKDRILFVTYYSEHWPPVSWGACQLVCYELSLALQSRGIETRVITPKAFDAVQDAMKSFQPTIVHFQYDDYAIGAFFLKNEYPTVRFCATGHFAYLCSPELLQKEDYYFDITFQNYCKAVKAGVESYCLSDAVEHTYRTLGNGIVSKRIYNGASTRIRWTPEALIPSRAICLARIEPRKGQYRLREQSNVDFLGPVSDASLAQNLGANYRGEWSRVDVEESLTNYGILVLLSRAEVASLVVLEALMAGLGLVVTEEASANLDRTKPWIRILTQEEADNPHSVKKAISETLAEASYPGVRASIRQYAEEFHSWDRAAEQYCKTLGLKV